MALEQNNQVLPSLRKRGRKKLPVDRLRRHAVTPHLTDEELVIVDRSRGKMSRAEWLRVAALNNPPEIIPQINREAWLELARSAANLNQLAKSANQGGALASLSRELAEFRAALIGAKWRGA